jgi:hypothetical protein
MTGWIVVAVAWAMLCVGVRHIALGMGIEMERLVTSRHELVAHVQSLEMEVAGAKQYERLERLAVAGGYEKPSAAQVVVAGEGNESGGGLVGRLTGWFRGGAATAYEEPASIRNRSEVVSRSPSAKWLKNKKNKSRKAPKGTRKR